jgi:fibronectin type 3 domain-containing protein
LGRTRGAKLAAAAAAVSALAALGLVGGAAASPSSTPHAPHAPHPPHPERKVCGDVAPGEARCHADVLLAADGVTPEVTGSPAGLSPSTMKSVYNFPTTASAGTGETIAIVDAFDDPNAQSDLNTFSTQFGLPCNGCLTKVNEFGMASPLPSSNVNWALEISLDVQWAHAIAPGAHILLVEAKTANFPDLGDQAEMYAAQHANYVSNSWGGPEFSYESTYDTDFSQPGVSFFVSSGDGGTPAEYPSASPNVISVGGTTLSNIGKSTFAETAWSSGGGGCSAYETATSAQSSFSQYGQVHCNGKRATPDVSSDANPSSGVAVYDTQYGGWIIVGGTSAASPVWAARSAVAGYDVDSSLVYGNTIPFRDITQGNNGDPALVGYDLATGRGSWADVVAVPAPGAPTLLTANGGAGSASLTWSAPTSGGPVASYNVYRTASAGPVILVGSGIAGTTFTDTNVPPGTYTYDVTAVNTVNVEGPPSNSLNATVTAPAPGAPTLISATPGASSVALMWQAPSSGGPIASYNLYRGTSSGGESLLVSGITSTSYNDSVSPGTYFYEVTAVNTSNVEGSPSNERSATVTPPTPGAPTLLSATGGVGSVSLGWQAPSSGGPVASYNVYRGTSSGAESLLVSGVTTTTYHDSVSPGTYFYEVTAVNTSSVEGPVSNELSATSTAGAPGAPTLMSAAGGPGTVTLGWSAPTSGGPVASYNLYRGTSSGSETLLVSGITTTTYQDSVSAGTYFYEVTAVNTSSVEGPLSNELSATATTPADEAPTASFTKACTFSSCTLSSTSTDPDGKIVKYTWSGGNNLHGTTWRFTHAYTAVGTFPVTLTVQDSSGQLASANGSVTCSRDHYNRLVCA